MSISHFNGQATICAEEDSAVSDRLPPAVEHRCDRRGNREPMIAKIILSLKNKSLRVLLNAFENLKHILPCLLSTRMWIRWPGVPVLLADGKPQGHVNGAVGLARAAIAVLHSCANPRIRVNRAASPYQARKLRQQRKRRGLNRLGTVGFPLLPWWW